MSQPSRIFTSYKALGYNDHMRLIAISPIHDHDITCLTCDSCQVFSADGNVIRSWVEGSRLSVTYVGHEKPVHLMLAFAIHLISIDEDSTLKVWEIQTAEIYVELQFNNDSFRITAIVHPVTYLNKILLGSQQGALQLWNLKSGLLIHTFSGFGSAVTALKQAPAVDVIAIGLANGDIVIQNIKYDETIMTFEQQDWGPVTALSFRTDGQPILASSGTQGHIAIWNLEEKKLHSQIRTAHVDAVAGMEFLPDEPLLITNSADNSIKMWIFDMSDGGGRLLKSREGHARPPTRIRFYGCDGHNILSAGGDSTLRNFSTVNDLLHCSLGHASYNRKKTRKKGLAYDIGRLPPIKEFSAEPIREKEWSNIAAVHDDLRMVTMWSYGCKKMSDDKLVHEKMKGSEVQIHKLFPTCVCVSCCGNFVIVGYRTGEVDMFNLQSGLYRGSYGDRRAHDGRVCGVASDGMNQVTVTVGIDKQMKFWTFITKKLLNTLALDNIVDRISLHRESALLGMAVDDFSLQALDMDTQKIVRRFDGHAGRITDFDFSKDSRWLVSASTDCSIRTWDIPSGRLIDCFLVDEICTSVTISPTGEYLATTHVDNVGVYLWVNKTLFSHISLRPLPKDYEPLAQGLPGAKVTDSVSQNTTGDDEMENVVDMLESMDFVSPEQISEDMVTLSLAPDSRWKNLLNLDTIKERNKPKQPMKVPKRAPFFLPTVPGLKFQFALPEKLNESGSKVLKSIPFDAATEFGRKLEKANTDEEYIEAMEMLKQLGPSGIEVEILSLAQVDGSSEKLFLKFLSMVDAVLRTNRDFELVQAYLALFLKLQGTEIVKDENLVQYCSALLQRQVTQWRRVQRSFNRCECIVSFLKNAAL